MSDTTPEILQSFIQPLHSKILSKTPQPFYTYLYGIDIDTKDVVELFSGRVNIYDVIDSGSIAVYKDLYQILCFVTSGYAAPSDSELDVPPSEHPEAKRVVLSNYVYIAEPIIISAVDFEDNPETLWEHTQNTTGKLKEALQSIYEH